VLEHLDLAQSANILVVDDDPTIREYVRLHLSSANFQVRVAEDGEAGYALAVEDPPDLILSDISMPKMDGFQFLEKIRGNALLADIPIILLTQHNDTSAFRRGMDLGADDFLSKPVRRAELLKSISSRLKRLEGLRRGMEDSQPSPTNRLGSTGVNAILAAASDPRANHLRASSAEPAPTMLVRAVSEDAAKAAAPGTITEKVQGSVLFSDIRGFTTFAERLTSDEVVELLNAYFSKACEPVIDQNGWVVKFVGDGVIAMFDGGEGQRVSHAERALKAGLLMLLAASKFDAWIKKRFPKHDLPPFAIGIGVHSGEVSVCKMGNDASAETTVIGDTVNVASRLENLTKELGWSLVASTDTVKQAGTRILNGQAGQAPVKGRDGVIDIVEVIGLAPKASSGEAEIQFYDSMRAAVRTNAELIAKLRPSTGWSASGTGALAAATSDSLVQLQGYRLIKKLGEGGMSRVFLAEHTATGEQQVLKLIQITEDDGGEMLQRFISEYALISQIHHPNVAKIFTQGFSSSHAYIAMEYFPGGDLRKMMKQGASPETAIAVLMQVAGALGAIHEMGMVHRDMKPDNIMIRADGSLALADFGIATQRDTRLDKTAHGEVFGTPAYISPEQATASKVDHRTDLYALGVMFFELLTGKKPYRASNTQALIYQHLNLPIPDLPPELAHLQAIVNATMAKSADDRVSSANELIDMAIAASDQSF
jgi:serine/threonine-protein kinase PpkA